MIFDKLTWAVAIILGIAIGFGFGFLSKTLADKLQIAQLSAERDNALLAKQTMQKQWEVAVNELNATKVVLNDTLSALELLRKYQLVDDKTKKDIDSLKTTLNPEGELTDKTKDLFKSMVNRFNQLNGNTSAMITDATQTFDLAPFITLRQEAEKLYNETQTMVLELGLGVKK